MWNKIKVFFKKYGLKVLFWLLVIVAIISATINIRLAFLFDGKLGNVFTAISGWVSFLATILVGYIAYKQNKEYKLENNRFEKRQEDRDWCQDKYETLSLYRERINKSLDLFLEFQPLESVEKIINEVLDKKVVMQDTIVNTRLEIQRSNLFMSLSMTEYYVEGGIELYDNFLGFMRIVKASLEELKNVSSIDKAGALLYAMREKYAYVLHWFKFYLSNLDDFLSKIVLSRNKELLEKDLKNRKEKQDAWVESIMAKAKEPKKAEVKDND